MSRQLYNQRIKEAMSWLAEQPDTIFLGQNIVYGGTAIADDLQNIPDNKKLEFPVAENLQIGVSTGMAINGLVPVSVFPRWNFLLVATDQIVNHLDKMSSLSRGRCQPKVIIRVAVGSENPVDPQDQHKGDFSDAFSLMCKNIEVIRCLTPDSVLLAYQKAYTRTDGRSTIVVELSDYGK
jgi:pyruvate/2-oxoglutarate/acetoin dehydrogenase E1 component